LDEQKETDLVDDSNSIQFVMEKDLFEQFGDMRVEFMQNGYFVGPVKPSETESGCSSCSSGGCNS